jgi:hypothetical protein
VRETNRTLEQNALLHELFGQLESGKLEWGGKARTAAEWKVLLISGHSIATGGEAEIVRGLEDELVNIRESSAAMSIKRLNSLIEYTQAFLETMVAK